MAWVAVDEDGSEWVYYKKPFRNKDNCKFDLESGYVELPQGSIKKLIGRQLTWDDEPVGLKEP